MNYLTLEGIRKRKTEDEPGKMSQKAISQAVTNRPSAQRETTQWPSGTIP